MPKGEHLKGKGGVKFGEGQPTDRGGRPKKIYTILKEKGFSRDDIRTCFGEMAFYSEKELKEVALNKDSPAIMKVIAMAFKKAMDKGSWSHIREIMEHTIGKPTQRLEHTGNDGGPIETKKEEIDWDSVPLDLKVRLLEEIENGGNDKSE